jgi:hypothetical protein
VSLVDGNSVLFEETIGFSESGGQESDRMRVNAIEVLSSWMDMKNTQPTSNPKLCLSKITVFE